MEEQDSKDVPSLRIRSIGDPILRKVARRLSKDELLSDETQHFIDELIHMMRDANGAGIAAPQVGRSLQICVLEVNNNPRYPYKPTIPLTVLVNPRLEAVGKARFKNYEGCLSVPKLRGVVSRFAEVRVQALDRHGNVIDRLVKGITAGTYQHECDHLEGTLFVDRVEDPSTLCTWDNFKRYHEASFIEEVRNIVARYGS